MKLAFGGIGADAVKSGELDTELCTYYLATLIGKCKGVRSSMGNCLTWYNSLDTNSGVKVLYSP